MNDKKNTCAAKYSRTYLGLGSNLENPAQQVQLAIQHIIETKQIQFIAQSQLFQNKALLHPDRLNEIQQDYINAVIAVDTSLTPVELLNRCQQIENQMGRIHSSKRWEARIIDIDILLFDDLTISSINLTIPHPEMKNRIFVLKPLFEIAADLVLPDGDSIKKLLKI